MRVSAARLVHRQVGHGRHAVVLDLAEAQRAGPARMVADQRLEHEGPVRGNARRAVLGHVRQEGIAVLRIGTGQHGAGGVEELHAVHAVQGTAHRVPAGRVGAAEAVQQVLRLLQWQIAGADLHVQQHQVDVQEEVQIDMHDVQQQRHITRLRYHAHLRDVAAAEQPHRRTGRAGMALRAAIAVEKTLHIGQEGDELVVVAFVEVVGVAGVFVHHLLPHRRRAGRCQQLPGPGDPARGQRHQPQRPKQHLTQVPHLRPRRNARRGTVRAGHGAQCRGRQPGSTPAWKTCRSKSDEPSFIVAHRMCWPSLRTLTRPYTRSVAIGSQDRRR